MTSVRSLSVGDVLRSTSPLIRTLTVLEVRPEGLLVQAEADGNQQVFTTSFLDALVLAGHLSLPEEEDFEDGAVRIEYAVRALLGSETEACPYAVSLDFIDGEVIDVRSFKDAEVLTSDRGLVITLADHSEYHVTIVRSA